MFHKGFSGTGQRRGALGYNGAMENAPRTDFASMLQSHGINRTKQRILLASLLFTRNQHVGAPALYRKALAIDPTISRSTVYNTLELFRAHGMVQELVLDSGRRIFDTNMEPHHHLVHEDTGEIEDLDHAGISVQVPPKVLGGRTLAGVDVTVRVRD